MPIQILPPGYSFGAEFGKAIGSGAGAGINEGLERRRERQQKQKEEEKQKKQLSTARDYYKEITGKEIPEDLPAEMQFDLFKYEMQKGLEREKQEARYGAKTKAFQELMGGEEKPSSSSFMQNMFSPPEQREEGPTPPFLETQEEPRKQNKKRPRPASKERPPHTQQEIDAAAMVDPTVANNWQRQNEDWHRRKEHAETAQDRKAAALQKETLPVREEIAERADAARRGIENKENLMKIIETGNINDPTIATVLDQLPFNFGKRMLSPETVEYKAGLIDEFGDLRKIFQGQTRVKEIELLEQKIPDIYLTDEQKRTILGSRMNALKADIIRADVAAELEAEGKNYGILNYRKEVEKRAKPRLDALFNRTLDEQKAVIKDAENRKKIPLDFDDPEGRQILEQIMKESGGDRTKARKLAKEKGYLIGK